MYFLRRCIVFGVLCLVFAPLVALAQDCPTIVNAALSAVDSACSGTGRNQVCYGNIHLNATPQDGKTLTFEKSGDIADVADLKALELSSMSLTDESWGVAMMKLQANLPDTVPGQNVTVLLFGNVQIDSTVETPVELAMRARRGVNVRLRPTTNATILTSLKSGQAVVANGRLRDSSWVRVKLDQGVGWVAAAFLSTTGNVNSLNVVDPASVLFGPMQSFYFKSGVGDRPCEEAPDSGILIQTPKGAAHVTFQINDAEITFGSTVYLQAQPSGYMTVTVVEGQVRLAAQHQSMLIPAGTFAQVQLNANGGAAGTPSVPKPYDLKPLQTLPLTLPVFNGVKIATPLTTAQINAILYAPTPTPSPAGSGSTAQSSASSSSGKWNQTIVTTVDTCNKKSSVGATTHSLITLTFSESRDTVVWGAWETHTLSRVSENVYQGVFDYNHLTLTLTFTSATTFTFSWVGIYPAFNDIPACDFSMEASGVLQR
jgi:Bacterial SH3 domain